MAMVGLQSLYDRARAAMAAGEHDRAEAICQHILQYYPHDLGTFQLLGQINLERKQARTARDCFRKVLEIDPENVSAHWGMGIAYQDEGKLEQAISEFEQALEIKPDLSDLRTQLLRLYGELYGAPRAQLHLSRAGLGRLYVKGEMLDKAVEEFREVLKADPNRADVQSSLLEALWQSGQVAQAAQVAEALLQRLPNALKANLVLGYIRLSAGKQAEAEDLLRRALACDPNNTMARAIFEMAPMRLSQGVLSFDAATLPDFDEAAWQEAQRRAAEEAAAAPAVEEAPPVAAAAAPAVAAPAAEEAAPLGISWLDALATGEGAVKEEEGEAVAGVAPFSLEGLEEAAAGLGAEMPLPGAEAATAEEALPMFSGAAKPQEEPLAFPGMEAAFAEQPAAARPAKEPAVSPFSLADLGLSPEEIASLEEAVAATRREETPTAPPPEMPLPPLPETEEMLPGLAPFSLEGVTAEVGEEEAVPGVEPFSVEAFGLEEVTPDEIGLEAGGELKPFSLEDLGLEEVAPSAREVEGLPGGIGEEAETGLPAFSWQEPGWGEAPAFREQLQPEEPVPSGPTLFEKMMASRGGVAGLPEEAPTAGEAPAVAAGEPGAEPFSLQGLEEALALEGGAPGEAPAPPAGEEAGAAEMLAAPAEAVKPFSLEELGLEEGLPAAEEAMVGVQPFSLADLGLEEGPAAEAGGQVPPFSLEELGLEEPAAAAMPVGELPFSLEGLGLEAPQGVAAAPSEAEEALKPFSLEELLPPEEIAAPELVAEVPAEAPVVLEEAAPAEMAAVGPSLEELRAQVQVNPQDDSLRLSLARACVAEGASDEALGLYRDLIKKSRAGLDEAIAADLRAWIENEQDRTRLYRLHRLLGDLYMKQGLYQQAMNEMAWVLSKS